MKLASLFSPPERANLFSKNENERLDYFFDLWSLKESYIKAIGKGLYQPLSEFTISIDSGQNISAASHGALLPYYFKQFKIDEKYKLALCASEEIKKETPISLTVEDILKNAAG